VDERDGLFSKWQKWMQGMDDFQSGKSGWKGWMIIELEIGPCMCYMDKHFLVESCNCVENLYLINPMNSRNISYMENFLENLYRTHVLMKMKTTNVILWWFMVWFTTFAFG
jgi:hypothetical protein